MALFSAHFWDSQTTTHLHLSQGGGNESGETPSEFSTFSAMMASWQRKNHPASPFWVWAYFQGGGRTVRFGGRLIDFYLEYRTIQWWRCSIQLSVASVFQVPLDTRAMALSAGTPCCNRRSSWGRFKAGESVYLSLTSESRAAKWALISEENKTLKLYTILGGRIQSFPCS